MPYTVSKSSGEKARKQAEYKQPFGPGLKPDQAANVERLEVIGSTFSDPGPDWCEWRAFDKDGTLIASIRSDGY